MFLSNPLNTIIYGPAYIPSYSLAEDIIGMVGQYTGLISICIIIVLIGLVFDNQQSTTNLSLILMILFIAFDLLKTTYLDIDPYLNIWVYLGIVLIYAVFRGVAVSKARNSLNIPFQNYGNKFFTLYAWSFLFTSVITIIIWIIIETGDYYTVKNAVEAGIWVSTGQLYLDAIAWAGMALAFFFDSASLPVVESKIKPRTAPDVDTRVQLGMGHYKKIGMKRPEVLDEFTEEELEEELDED